MDWLEEIGENAKKALDEHNAKQKAQVEEMKKSDEEKSQETPGNPQV